MQSYLNQKIKHIKLDADFRHGAYKYYGVIIHLTDGWTLKFGIDDQSQCCEDWGYITTLDNPDDFIDAKVLDIFYTETALNSGALAVCGEPLDINSCMFITVKTNKGDFQLVVYNEHNGYYGHHTTCFIEQTLLDHKL